MSTLDKAKNKVEQGTGAVKEHVGSATGDRSLQADGKSEQAKGHLKDAGEKVKDALKV